MISIGIIWNELLERAAGGQWLKPSAGDIDATVCGGDDTPDYKGLAAHRTADNPAKDCRVLMTSPAADLAQTNVGFLENCD